MLLRDGGLLYFAVSASFGSKVASSLLRSLAPLGREMAEVSQGQLQDIISLADISQSRRRAIYYLNLDSVVVFCWCFRVRLRMRYLLVKPFKVIKHKWSY